MSSREAALMLHALCESDQAWILARLPDTQQGLLRNHLAELEELGIPADPELSRSVIRPPAPTVAGSARERVAQADAAAIHQILGMEPAWLIAALMAQGPWDWQAALLAQLDADRRRMIGEHLQAPSELPRGQADALLHAMATRLAALAPATFSKQPAPWMGLAGRLRSWLP